MTTYKYRLLILSFEGETGEHVPYVNEKVSTKFYPGERIVKVFDKTPEYVSADKEWRLSVLLEREEGSSLGIPGGLDEEQLTEILKGPLK